MLSIGSNSGLLSKHFVLIHDIDLDPNLPGGRVFDDALIGRDTNPKATSGSGLSFSGVCDGQGHVIRRLCIAGKYGYDMGLFGRLSGWIKNLHLPEVQISGAPCGALAGYSHDGMVSGCSVTGKVTGSHIVGGLIADAHNTTIVRCDARASVVGDVDCDAGGLVGSTGPLFCQVIECRAIGTVTGGKSAGGLIGYGLGTTVLRCAGLCDVVAQGDAGGLIGRAFSNLSVIDCYAGGSAAGSTVGGLIGDAGDGTCTYILNSHAVCGVLGLTRGATAPVVGGLFGERNWHFPAYLVAGCFWDVERSGIPVATGFSWRADFGTGLTTEQMRQQTIFEQAGWDFGYAWTMPDNGSPALQWESAQDTGRKL